MKPLVSVLTLLAAVVLGRVAVAQSPDRTSPESALSDLHEGASAAGWADVDALRALPWFEEVVRHNLREMGVSQRAIHQTLTMLTHTHRAHASLVRSSGDVAVFAAVTIHGDYPRNEVPNAVQGILPALLAALWEQSTIDGHRAYDMGVAALVEITPNDWILARRIRGALPLPGATPADDLRALIAEGRRLGVPEGRESLAYGVLVGPPSILPGQPPPATLEEIYQGPRQATASFVAEGDVLVVNWDVILHHASDATAWETHYRSAFTGLAPRLHVPDGSIRFTLTRTDTRLTARVELDRTAADAFVAELVGRALPPAAPSATPAP